MQKYFNYYLDDRGEPIRSGSVLVQTSAGASATIYDADGNTATNPITTNTTGYFEFYAPNGRYTLYLSKSGHTSTTIENVLLDDPTVATIATLRAAGVPTTSNARVKVLGHTTVGVGGGDFYWDASSSDADDNGITILPTGYAGVGRWKRSVTNGTLPLEAFACLGDNSTDDATELASAFASGYNLIGTSGKTYLSSTAQTMSANTTLNLNGATLKFNGSGAVEDLKPVSGCRVINGTVENAGSLASGAGNYQCPILVGDYGVGTGYNGIEINGITLKNNRSNGNGILVTGASYNITISNISVPDSSTIGRPILIHWGGATTPASGTYHPHDITIENVHAGAMSNTDTDFAVVFLSGTHNVTVRNVHAESVDRALCTVRPGDYGYYYAQNIDSAQALQGIIFDGCSVDSAADFGFYVDGLAELAPGTPVYRTGITFRRCGAKGNSSTVQGFLLQKVRGVTIEDCWATGFASGVLISQDADFNVVRGGEYYSNTTYGVSVTNGTDLPQDNTIEGIHAYLNGTAGIYAGQAYRTKVLGNFLGDKSSETTQLYGVRVDTTSVDADIQNNHCYDTEAGGTGFSLASGTSYGTVRSFWNNVADSAVPTAVGGVSPRPLYEVPAGTTSKRRLFVGTAVPSAGTWQVGDTVIDPVSAQGAVEWQCVTAGTPGTWRATKWVTGKGSTAARPTPTADDIGVTYLDTTLDADGKPIWWNGSAWVDATGATV